LVDSGLASNFAFPLIDLGVDVKDVFEYKRRQPLCWLLVNKFCCVIIGPCHIALSVPAVGIEQHAVMSYNCVTEKGFQTADRRNLLFHLQRLCARVPLLMGYA
jgi:hypothetical protein